MIAFQTMILPVRFVVAAKSAGSPRSHYILYSLGLRRKAVGFVALEEVGHPEGGVIVRIRSANESRCASIPLATSDDSSR